LEDLGRRFGRDKSFCFDYLVIEEIIFDETDDITLYCKVLYFDVEHQATFGLTFTQLSIILRTMSTYGTMLTEAIADKMVNQEKKAITILAEEISSMPIEVTNCMLFTTLTRIDEADIIWDDEEEDESTSADKKEEGKEDTPKSDKKEEDVFAKLNRLRKERLSRDMNKDIDELLEGGEEEDEPRKYPFDKLNQGTEDQDEGEDEDVDDEFDDMEFEAFEFEDPEDSEYVFFVDDILILPPTN
jgi:hypothetical protein